MGLEPADCADSADLFFMKISVYQFNPIHQRSYVIVIAIVIVIVIVSPLNSYMNYFPADMRDIV